MGYVGSLVWFVAIVISVHAYNPDLGAKVDILIARMRQLEKKNYDIAKQNSELAEQNSELSRQNSEIAKQNNELAMQSRTCN